MTARELIDDIFARAQLGMPANMRRITGDQVKFLRDLIRKDREGGQVTRGDGGSLVWMPAGTHKFVVTEDPNGGKKHTLTRLSNLVATESARLF